MVRDQLALFGFISRPCQKTMTVFDFTTTDIRDQSVLLAIDGQEHLWQSGVSVQKPE